MRRRVEKWSAEEDAFLRANYATSTRREIAATLGRTDGMIRGRCTTLELNTKLDMWSDEEVATLRREYAKPVISIAKLAKLLGRTHASVALKASKLGLGNFKRPRKSQLGLDLWRFKDKNALREHHSTRVKKWIKDHGHPRGSLGMKHTPEAVKAMRDGARRMWADPSHRVNSPEYRQRLSDNLGETRKAGKIGAHRTYSRCASGKRADLDGRFFRSSWEANYARFLNWRVGRGELSGWAYECQTFYFETIKRGTRSYTPDFKVTYPDGRYEWHEVKGWMDQKSRTRLDRMARYYPEETVVVIGEEWFRSANRTFGHILPNWERQAKKNRAA